MTSPPLISSTHNPLIRRVLKLRDNRYRQREQVMLVDGVREISRALDAGLRIRSLLVAAPRADQPRADQPRADPLLANDPRGEGPPPNLLAAAGSAVTLVTEELLAKVAYGGNPRGAVAVLDCPEPRNLSSLPLPANPLVLVLSGVEKPGNVGAIFRSADAVGADAVILCGPGCDLFNPNLIRSSLGTVFSITAAQADESETLDWIHRRGLACVTTIVGAPRVFWDADYRGPTAIVLGSEAEGLAGAWRSPPSDRTSLEATPVQATSGNPRVTEVSIPMLGAADSLNVSVAAAVLLFEARRQRRPSAP